MRIHTKQPTASDQGKEQQKVKVLVSGFARQSLIGIDEIAAAIDALPAFHLSELSEIIYDPDWETVLAQDLLDAACPRRSKAAYLPEDRSILVFEFSGIHQFRHVLYHEIGHHVFQRVLDSTQRVEWVGLFSPGGRFVTRYAARNPTEDFAESYALFVRHPKRLERIWKKYAFLRDQVFGGIACNLKQGHLDMLA